jgi:hypothetical protein
MLDRLERERRTDQVSRLASLPYESLEAILLDLGIGIEDLDEVRDAAVKNNVVVTPEDVVRFSFQRDRFWPGRFNRETYGVYYAALEPQTCIEELRHHRKKSITAQSSAQYYRFIFARFDGFSVDLRGQEEVHPELISKDESGYPFCQDLADAARATGIDGFYTFSARQPSGTCVPVFSQGAVHAAALGGGVRFYWDGSAVAHIEF